MAEPLMVTVHTDVASGRTRLTVDHWPSVTEIDDAVLAQADPSCIQRDGDLVTIRVANGQAVYQLGPANELTRSYPAHLVSSRWSEPDEEEDA